MDIGTLASKLTVSNRAITDLKDLMILTTFLTEELGKYFTFMQNVNTGDKLGWTGEMNDVGKAGNSCNPTYENLSIQAAQKEWAIGKWEIPLKLCYTEIEQTIAQYCLKSGTDIQDLTDTEYMDIIVVPALERAMYQMAWRLIWFGDTAATNIASSGSGDNITYTGSITAGVNVELMKPCNGLWKQLFALGTASSAQVTTIAANAEKTYALQKSKLRESGVAIAIFDAMIADADARIDQLEGAAIYCTKSLADALTADLKREYKLILEWKDVFGGLKVTEYEGRTIYAVSIWDRFIKKYQDNGVFLNKPHRAFFGAPSQVLVGSPANQIISTVDVWFDKKDRQNYMYSAGQLGTLLGEDSLFHLAY